MKTHLCTAVYETLHDPHGNMTASSLILNSAADSVCYFHFTLQYVCMKYNEDETAFTTISTACYKTSPLQHICIMCLHIPAVFLWSSVNWHCSLGFKLLNPGWADRIVLIKKLNNKAKGWLMPLHGRIYYCIRCYGMGVSRTLAFVLSLSKLCHPVGKGGRVTMETSLTRKGSEQKLHNFFLQPFLFNPDLPLLVIFRSNWNMADIIGNQRF